MTIKFPHFHSYCNTMNRQERLRGDLWRSSTSRTRSTNLHV